MAVQVSHLRKDVRFSIIHWAIESSCLQDIDQVCNITQPFRTRRSIKAYTGLPVVRVNKEYWVVLNCRVPVNFFQVGGH